MSTALLSARLGRLARLAPVCAALCVAACAQREGRPTPAAGTADTKLIAPGSPGVEHHTQVFLERIDGKPPEELGPDQARAALATAQSSVALEWPGAAVTERIVVLCGEPLRLTIVRPPGVTGALPAFMFFPGGGWVLGDFATHERLVRDLVAASGAVAVFVSYDLSPEARYPRAINQAYAATCWVATHGREIGVDGRRLAVAGNSAGANMAAVVALLAKEEGTPRLAFQLLLWPVTNGGQDTDSYREFATGHFLTRDTMRWFWDCYATRSQRRERHASPLRATLKQLRGLPPTLIQTAEKDVLRDEGEAYGRKLDEAGVDVTVTRYNGMIHDFGLLNALSHVAATRSALRQAGQELRHHLLVTPSSAPIVMDHSRRGAVITAGVGASAPE